MNYSISSPVDGYINIYLYFQIHFWSNTDAKDWAYLTETVILPGVCSFCLIKESLTQTNQIQKASESCVLNIEFQMQKKNYTSYTSQNHLKKLRSESFTVTLRYWVTNQHPFNYGNSVKWRQQAALKKKHRRPRRGSTCELLCKRQFYQNFHIKRTKNGTEFSRLGKNDIFALLPTGFGKSLYKQCAVTWLTQGADTCLVLSPCTNRKHQAVANWPNR